MTQNASIRACQIIDRCRQLARCTEIAGQTTRIFLSPPMHDVHTLLRGWMEAAGMSVRIDAIGNLRGVYAGEHAGAPRLIIGSHLDTVPNAGAFDGILGVLLGVAVVEELRGQRLPFAIEIIGFSEEEGVRFGRPFLGSLALIGRLPDETLACTDESGITVARAIENFGLSHLPLEDAALAEESFAYLEFHIEQGPVLDIEDHPLAVVDAIAGQSRLQLVFTGHANHAGTTPMHLRHDAMAAAANWIVEVERYATSHTGLVATVGRVEAKPGAANVVPGHVIASLDVRHAQDDARHTAVSAIVCRAELAARSRGVTVTAARLHDQAAVSMNTHLVKQLVAAVGRAGCLSRTVTSGAGHDAMIVAERLPSVMLFLRSPGGISHHPEESVLPQDVELALAAAMEFLKDLQQTPPVGYRL